jgi:Ca2+-binding RTX toxin-like protein
MMQRKQDVRRIFALTSLLGSLAGCGASDSPDPEPPSAASNDPVDVAVAELGVQIDGCEEGTGTAFAAGVLTLNVEGDPLVLSAPGSKITVNGYTCTGTVAAVPGTQLTTLNVSKILINGDSGDNKVIVDLLPGPFGTKIFATTGGILVDFATTGGADVFMLRGSVNTENVKIAKIMGSGTQLYFELNGDKAADISVKPSADGTAITLSLGGGADSVNAATSAGDITTFGVMTPAIVVAGLDAATSITAYGGAGIDTFQGGLGDDTFYGGPGNDIFKMAATADGADTYVGDADIDTVDYSNRTAALNVDIGPATPSAAGTIDLATIDFADLNGTDLVFSIDSADDTTVSFALAVTPADIVDQINDEFGSRVASLQGQNHLVIASPTTDGTVEVIGDGTAAEGVLGLEPGEIADTVDADDGLIAGSGEGDDVRSSTENITGGTADDVLFGDAAKNTIKGGGGNDTLSGGWKTTATCATTLTQVLDGDVLNGDAGSDTFLMPSLNCWAQANGGVGDNVVDFSGRGVAMVIKNDGLPNDGDMAANEKINIATDVLKLVGGFGDDQITGGPLADTLVGGPGGDLLSGGLGFDTADYSSYATGDDLAVTLCFLATGCAADDGAHGENDTIQAIERVVGGAGADVINATGATVDVTLEGNDGDDTLTGGSGNDVIWGDDGDDELNGGAGADNITAGLGDDEVIGGADDGDICVWDPAEDTTDPAIECEL